MAETPRYGTGETNPYGSTALYEQNKPRYNPIRSQQSAYGTSTPSTGISLKQGDTQKTWEKNKLHISLSRLQSTQEGINQMSRIQGECKVLYFDTQNNLLTVIRDVRNKIREFQSNQVFDDIFYHLKVEPYLKTLYEIGDRITNIKTQTQTQIQPQTIEYGTVIGQVAQVIEKLRESVLKGKLEFKTLTSEYVTLGKKFDVIKNDILNGRFSLDYTDDLFFIYDKKKYDDYLGKLVQLFKNKDMNEYIKGTFDKYVTVYYKSYTLQNAYYYDGIYKKCSIVAFEKRKQKMGKKSWDDVNIIIKIDSMQKEIDVGNVCYDNGSFESGPQLALPKSKSFISKIKRGQHIERKKQTGGYDINKIINNAINQYDQMEETLAKFTF